jgi:phospholipid/cholesterol/gamma-HCH transport system ATP-binding protein
MIEVKNLDKKFGEKHVIKNISTVFERGKMNLIIGESGCGKTVLSKLMVGLFVPDSGDVLYDGESFLKMDFEGKKKIRKKIGMLFQGGALFDSLTVEQNVMFPLNMFTSMSDEEKLERVNECLNRVNLVNVNKLYPAEISGGMKKRVGIARAIAMKPSYLFCDEPNSGLDPKTAIVIDNLIKEITEENNMTTIVITHDMNSVIEVGENINFIYKGELWWKGSNNEILKTDDEHINNFVYCSSFMKKIKGSFHV